MRTVATIVTTVIITLYISGGDARSSALSSIGFSNHGFSMAQLSRQMDKHVWEAQSSLAYVARSLESQRHRMRL